MVLDTRREAIVVEARSWDGTPYIRDGRIKGPNGGCDCATLLMMVYYNCGLTTAEDYGVFGDDWFAHTAADRYLFRIMRSANRIFSGIAYGRLHSDIAILPGDIALVKCADSPVWNHGAIILDWPTVIHSVAPKVEIVNASTHRLWKLHQITVFDPFVVQEELASHVR